MIQELKTANQAQTIHGFARTPGTFQLFTAPQFAGPVVLDPPVPLNLVGHELADLCLDHRSRWRLRCAAGPGSRRHAVLRLLPDPVVRVEDLIGRPYWLDRPPLPP